MREIKPRKLLDLNDILWGFENLFSKSERECLREIIKGIPKEKFNATYGKKLSLPSYNQKLEEIIFKSEPIQSLVKVFEDLEFIKIIGDLLYSGNSDIFEHIEYHGILNKSEKFTLIDQLSSQKYKLLPMKIDNNSYSHWRGLFKLKKEDLKNFILKKKVIPYTPSFSLSIIDKQGFIMPHTDVSSKIASFMIYLPKNDDERNSLLGTTFWKPKPLVGNGYYTQNIKNSNLHLGFKSKEYEQFTKYSHYPIRTKFQEEYTLLFFRSSSSWHSFEYDQKIIGPRISINVNFNFPDFV